MALTFGTSGTRVTCMSSSGRLSGSSGPGSAAPLSLVHRKTRFARKPLMNTHWFLRVLPFQFNERRISEGGMRCGQENEPGPGAGPGGCFEMLHWDGSRATQTFPH